MGLTFNHGVEGSSPSALTNKFNSLDRNCHFKPNFSGRTKACFGTGNEPQMRAVQPGRKILFNPCEVCGASGKVCVTTAPRLRREWPEREASPQHFQTIAEALREDFANEANGKMVVNLEPSARLPRRKPRVRESES